MVLRKSDLADLDIIDSEELLSDGYNVYLSTNLVSTNNLGSLITINLPFDGEGLITGLDHPAESGDRVYLVGTSGADGYYIINSVLTDLTFTVNGLINNSTGGVVYFMYPAGATRVGFDPTGLPTTATNVQDAIASLVGAPSGISAQVNGVPQGTVTTVNVSTSGFLDAYILGGILNISADSYILDIDGSITYIDDGVLLKKVVQ